MSVPAKNKGQTRAESNSLTALAMSVSARKGKGQAHHSNPR